MKLVIFIFGFMCWFYPAFGQSLSFPTNDASWKYETIVDFNENIGVVQQLSGDSLLNGIVYQKLLPSYEIPVVGGVFGLTREENGIVYFIPDGATDEVILYDFTVNQGDSFHINDFLGLLDDDTIVTVSSIENIVTLDGLSRKQFHFNNTIVIEGIGGIFGSVAYPWYFGSVSGDSYLYCFKDNSVNIYEDIVSVTVPLYPYGSDVYLYGCDGLIVGGTDLEDSSPMVQISRDLVNQTTIVRQYQSFQIESLRLFNSGMKLIQTISTEQHTFSIDENLPNGLYVLLVKTESKTGLYKSCCIITTINKPI